MPNENLVQIVETTMICNFGIETIWKNVDWAIKGEKL